MSRSGGIKPWPAVFQRKRNAAYLLRPCLPLATYPFTTIWIPWKAFLANYTAAAGARVPDNTPRLASVSLGERVISSTSVALPGHTNRGPVTRIEPWEEYHGMTRFQNLDTAYTVYTRFPRVTDRITFDQPAEDASRDCGGWKLTARHRDPPSSPRDVTRLACRSRVREHPDVWTSE